MPKIVVTKEDWIQKGQKYFAMGGSESLLIEKMARELGCSKSSFYWYFGNREEFITCIVNDWVERATNEVIDRTLTEESIDTQIKNLLTAMFSTTEAGDFVFYLRRLGQEHERYQQWLDTIEHKRIDFMLFLLQAKGLSYQSAQQKAFVIYHFYLGWHERNKHRKHLDDTAKLVELLWNTTIETSEVSE
ncbi:TetR/AcrR family transcriptional regulator [Paenibacillus apiarius]|uniref:TetR/AcrR family transcriptional regulator n=2 Tax=Paenibacillus apiarius TaxID=46240 RepID=A0ABT4DRT2_9BACL|nr:TetR/AcrR family transcriptional regulator [Paenibacillus apiarius]MCY9514340.1 TetR/AcrR family transcriptional regulator [Paenibacillus apiarius]MCY9520077.1 TetR/AcrR family transcriptional regulator [Paenibacillus apiarius]MCY9550083.1 TetR/AcrR family transcriptional regulator [Paenibacillus apiarius]MCY9560305.1 TetR/AcrR family transcriptional regulator [Paenibacillus apiarius]MCY9683202.1 TetR/AcrR family transcriptional regulator [Paenibacillus apiarius]